ncbi:MAG: hypothetical protein OXG44_10415 [Gammaproteobacteria bacterium]|nr:hypothetical protein [Gammaproteobacteria bacterium]
MTTRLATRSAQEHRRSTGPFTARPLTHRRTGTYLECPAEFSLESNFDEVVALLHKIRQASGQQRNTRTTIDFTTIEQLSPTAALVLAAELDRWNHLITRKLRPVDIHQWNPMVRRQLRDMGFFDLLAVPKRYLVEDDTNPDTRYVAFRTGNKADGHMIHQLRTEDLDPVVGTVPKGRRLYAAVTEAMTNVAQHAYQGHVQRPNWWLSASHNVSQRRVSVMIYDQGQGIPNTLPARLSERVMSVLRNDHARLIQAAHDLARTSSQKAHRGQGLARDVRGYLRDLDVPANYRVVSLRGEYSYTIDGGSSPGREDLITHEKALYGTLIAWELSVNDG